MRDEILEYPSVCLLIVVNKTDAAMPTDVRGSRIRRVLARGIDRPITKKLVYDYLCDLVAVTQVRDQLRVIRSLALQNPRTQPVDRAMQLVVPGDTVTRIRAIQTFRIDTDDSTTYIALQLATAIRFRTRLRDAIHGITGLVIYVTNKAPVSSQASTPGCLFITLVLLSDSVDTPTYAMAWKQVRKLNDPRVHLAPPKATADMLFNMVAAIMRRLSTEDVIPQLAGKDVSETTMNREFAALARMVHT